MFSHLLIARNHHKVWVWSVVNGLCAKPECTHNNQNSLCIGLFEQGAPEFIGISRVDEDQLAIVSGQSVVHDDVHPLPKVPEPKVKYSAISRTPFLVCRNHL